jgi:hypothetical protein
MIANARDANTNLPVGYLPRSSDAALAVATPDARNARWRLNSKAPVAAVLRNRWRSPVRAASGARRGEVGWRE